MGKWTLMCLVVLMTLVGATMAFAQGDINPNAVAEVAPGQVAPQGDGQPQVAPEGPQKVDVSGGPVRVHIDNWPVTAQPKNGRNGHNGSPGKPGPKGDKGDKGDRGEKGEDGRDVAVLLVSGTPGLPDSTGFTTTAAASGTPTGGVPMNAGFMGTGIPPSWVFWGVVAAICIYFWARSRREDADRADGRFYSHSTRSLASREIALGMPDVPRPKGRSRGKRIMLNTDGGRLDFARDEWGDDGDEADARRSRPTDTHTDEPEERTPARRGDAPRATRPRRGGGTPRRETRREEPAPAPTATRTEPGPGAVEAARTGAEGPAPAA